MKYSIIIPCFNEAHVLKESLSSIRKAIGERDDVEILLLDNGSSDGSAELARSFGVQVHILPHLEISALRNQGAMLSRGQYLLFLDADILVPDNWLATLDTIIEENSADVVGFVDKVPSQAPWFARIWGLRASARRSKRRTIDALPGRNLFMARHWFEKIGGFNEQLTTGEDKDFVMRLSKAGAQVISDPSLNMIHLGYERTFKEWCKKEYWRQHSHINLMAQQGISLRLLRFPLLSVAHLLINVAAVILLFSGHGLAAVLLLGASLIPSLGLSAVHPTSRLPLTRLLQFTLLYWLRFHIAGYSVIRELIERSGTKD